MPEAQHRHCLASLKERSVSQAGALTTHLCCISADRVLGAYH